MDSLALTKRPRRSHAHRDPDVRGGIDQPVEGEDVLLCFKPAHLPGREAEFVRCLEVLEIQFGDSVDYPRAQLRAQGGIGWPPRAPPP